MRRSFRFLAVLACALPLACSDTSTAPTTPVAAPRLSANPASNGSVIIRYNDWVGSSWVAWYDQAVNTIAVHSTGDIPALCVGGDPGFIPSDWKVVESGKFENLYHLVVDYPKMHLYIYAGGWETWNICNPIMNGLGTVHSTDNDRSGVGPGANAYGFVASGQVSDGNGQAYRYSGHVRGVVGPDGKYNESVLINLQPLN